MTLVAPRPHEAIAARPGPQPFRARQDHDRSTIRQTATRTGALVELAVSDSGIGIAAEDKARLFRPFEQLDAGLARKFEGTGLGLVMVKNLVELHGGSVGVESEIGKGSRFWVRFPAKRPPAFETQAPASDARLPRR